MISDAVKNEQILINSVQKQVQLHKKDKKYIKFLHCYCKNLGIDEDKINW